MKRMVRNVVLAATMFAGIVSANETAEKKSAFKRVAMTNKYGHVGLWNTYSAQGFGSGWFTGGVGGELGYDNGFFQKYTALEDPR